MISTPVRLLAFLVLFVIFFAGRVHPTRTPPHLLSETGLYADIASKTIAASNLSFSPQYPLWSDGARKKRWIFIPPKKSIDAKDPDDWIFPVGTKLWKEFSFGKRVETRLLEKTGPGTWSYASYAWSDDESDARLVPESGLQNYAEIAPGIKHDLPGVTDCKACHDGQGRDVPLGFNALQLSPDRDPNAPHAEQLTADMITLQTLVERKLLVHFPKRFIERPPRIDAGSSVARSALGYLSANCGGCHNMRDPLSSVGLFLKQQVEFTPEAARRQMESTIDAKSKYAIAGLGPDQSYRILPGDPAKSTIIYRMRSRIASRQMPPLGTKIVDTEAVNLISTWIQRDLLDKSGDHLITHH